MRINTDRNVNLPKMECSHRLLGKTSFRALTLSFHSLSHFRKDNRDYYRAIKRAQRAASLNDTDFLTATIETSGMSGIASGTIPRIRSSNETLVACLGIFAVAVGDVIETTS